MGVDRGLSVEKINDEMGKFRNVILGPAKSRRMDLLSKTKPSVGDSPSCE